MKDFYDLIFIAKMNSFNKTILLDAISQTFENRGTNLEDMHTIFSESFKSDFQKQTQWQAFLQLNKLKENIDFAEIVSQIQSFIQPVFDSKTKNSWNPNKWEWE